MITMRFHRILRTCFVVSYVCLATGLLHTVLDFVHPAYKRVDRRDFPCAGHSCGCATAEQCRSRCCCQPATIRPVAEPSHDAAPLTIRVSYAAAATCHGDGSSDAQHTGPSLDPHIPSLVLFPAPRLVARTISLDDDGSPLAFAEPLDHVPIS